MVDQYIHHLFGKMPGVDILVCNKFAGLVKCERPLNLPELICIFHHFLLASFLFFGKLKKHSRIFISGDGSFDLIQIQCPHCSLAVIDCPLHFQNSGFQLSLLLPQFRKRIDTSFQLLSIKKLICQSSELCNNDTLQLG